MAPNEVKYSTLNLGIPQNQSRCRFAYQPALTCSKCVMEIPEKYVKSTQS